MESAVDSASTASEVSGSSGGSPRVKAASPARAMSPPQLLAPRLPLPPPGLGLLGSLQMMHHSPLELMAAAHHHGPPRYGSPPPISTSDPSANECKLVDYRGQKVAAFIIQGDTMLCLPQAFELFLKHLVGGLHTVYTKLKRLDIVPLVCNVEQVRILRGLGAIQPGVNRCKLLSCKDFDVLYRDCTTARYHAYFLHFTTHFDGPPSNGVNNTHTHIIRYRMICVLNYNLPPTSGVSTSCEDSRFIVCFAFLKAFFNKTSWVGPTSHNPTQSSKREEGEVRLSHSEDQQFKKLIGPTQLVLLKKALRNAKQTMNLKRETNDEFSKTNSLQPKRKRCTFFLSVHKAICMVINPMQIRRRQCKPKSQRLQQSKPKSQHSILFLKAAVAGRERASFQLKLIYS
ncbi:hypothetical protein ABMA28_002228 [Loxostege sticticalis]|uniref:SKI/SNO/DAC domain-containing protein n=1 Tax=Loxostege sticticalis TaxID=481309 RepID=A0ABD0T0D3_LOXSC